MTSQNTQSQIPVMSIDGLSFAYGDKQILDDLNADLHSGEFMCIVGPSGAGKTTLLQCLAGLRLPTEGRVCFNDEQVTEPPKDLAVVFQDYSHSLMPWLSSRDNVALPLKSAGIGRKERNNRSELALQKVGLAGSEDKYPWQLSGGMQQRVAIARALACEPKAIIMDEPFASVDAQTRADLEDLVLDVCKSLGITVLLVTHDIDEAVYLSDRILVLSGKPATVCEIVDVDLGENRDQILTKELPRYAEVRSHVYRLIRRQNADGAAIAEAKA